MHIPDNYLSPATCAVMAAAVIPAWVVSVKKTTKDLPKEKLPLLGIGAAFSFLIMMLNVPLPGGTTGHAVGGTLLAVLLGPYAACIGISVALLIQALVFGDGGILAFGANCFNMAFVIPFVGYGIYRIFKARARTKKLEYIGLAIASYLAINAGALFASVEFGLQPLLFKDAAGMPLYCPYPLAVSIPAMLIPHLLVAGVVEAAFTVAIVAFVTRTAPGTIYEAGPAPKVKPLYALIAVLVAASPLGLLAAGTAWGEWGADEIKGVVTGGAPLGFVPAGMLKGSFEAPLPDYSVAGTPEVVGYLISAVLGAAILVILFKLVGLLRAGHRETGGAIS